jgi:Ca2+-binding EF-hand superfamily protein
MYFNTVYFMIHFDTDFNLLSVFTDYQIENYIDTFNSIDTNNNGVIEFEELYQYVINNIQSDVEFDSSKLKEVFDLIDTNHNGVLELDEFSSFLMKK